MSRSIAMMSMGESHHGLGRFREAIDYFTGVLTILREIGNCYHEGFALTLLGNTHVALGQWDAARSWYEQALAIHDSLKNRYGQAETLIGLAALLDDLHVPKTGKLRTRITASG